MRLLLGKIQEELKERDTVREEVQKNMRRATRLSKQAILLMHQERLGEAKKLLNEAHKLFAGLPEVRGMHSDLAQMGIVHAAFQEYAEAKILLSLIEDRQFVDPEAIGVPSISFVLGLADVIGELRRQALDSLRKGDLKRAEESLEVMEQIYLELIGMDEAYMFVPGLRRKGDVARHLIEATRADVTIEIGRSSLEESIKNLEKAVKRKRKMQS